MGMQAQHVLIVKMVVHTTF